MVGNVDAYVAKAVELASDRDGACRGCARISRARGTPARCSTPWPTTRALEAAYVAMADQYRRGVREPIDIG